MIWYRLYFPWLIKKNKSQKSKLLIIDTWVCLVAIVQDCWHQREKLTHPRLKMYCLPQWDQWLLFTYYLLYLIVSSVFSQRERYLTYPIGYFRPPALISTKNSYKIDGPLPSPFVDHSLASSANLLIQDEVFHLWVDFSPSIKWQPNSISNS